MTLSCLHEGCGAWTSAPPSMQFATFPQADVCNLQHWLKKCSHLRKIPYEMSNC